MTDCLIYLDAILAISVAILTSLPPADLVTCFHQLNDTIS